MPWVKIEMMRGKSPAYKKTLLDEVHRALVDAIKIPDHDRGQAIYEIDRDNYEVSPDKTENALRIELILYKGRSFEAKKTLYKTMVDYLEASLGISRNDVTIVIHEPSLDNWGVDGGKPASECDLGFKIDV